MSVILYPGKGLVKPRSRLVAGMVQVFIPFISLTHKVTSRVEDYSDPHQLITVRKEVEVP